LKKPLIVCRAGRFCVSVCDSDEVHGFRTVAIDYSWKPDGCDSYRCYKIYCCEVELAELLDAVDGALVKLRSLKLNCVA